MFKKVVLATALFVLVAVMMPAQTKAQSMSDALERMDEIIAEMQKLRTEFALLSAQVNGSGSVTPTPEVQGSTSGSSITQDVSYGQTNGDIERIQRLLATDPEIYDHPYVTGYFGVKTEEAIKRFQTRFGLEPVGVVGPSTTALLEVFFAAYPNENYPAGVLDNKPTGSVLGDNTTSSNNTGSTGSVGSNVPSSNPASSIEIDFDRGEAKVRIEYKNGNNNTFYVFGESESDLIEEIADRTPLSEAQVSAVAEFDGLEEDDDSDEEEEAEEAIDDADDAIDDADDEIDEAADDDEDTDWAEDTLDEAEDLLEDAEKAYDDGDYDEAIEKAEEAEEMAKEAEDRIGKEEGSEKGDKDDIDKIEVDVDEDEAEVTVEYDDGDEYEFTIEEDKRDEIIKEVADELDLDEDEVEDLIELDYGDIDSIDALIDEDDGDTEVEIEFENGWDLTIVIDEDDEDDIIEELADYFDVDEDDIEDVIDFEVL